MISLSDWFQLSPVPANAIEGYYDMGLVGLSYLIACLASFVALNLVGRLRAETNNLAKIYWLAGGAFSMGAGIWSMHFIGMLAFIMPMPMSYELSWTSGSLIVAMLASALALFILQKKNYSVPYLGLGGVLIGLGIATMHYMGMEGMKTHMSIHYLPGLFALSLLIGIIAAEGALYLALKSNQGSSKQQASLKLLSAMIMAVAICGMHYTGMEAAVFTPSLSHDMGMTGDTINPNYLAFFVAGITGLIISLALIASTYYKKMVNAIQNEKEFLNAMLNNLEDGIIACDDVGKITVLNHTLKKHISLQSEKLRIEDLPNYFSLFTVSHDQIHPEEFPLKKILAGETIYANAYRMRFNNGDTHEVVIDGQPIINSEGKKLGAVTAIHDVTELRQTEKLKNEFVSIVSHELRTPLTSIRGSLGLLVNGVMGEFPEKAMKLLTIANNNCERLLLLINDILDIEKIEAGKMDFQLQPVVLNTLVVEAIDANKMYADKYNVGIQLVQSSKELTVVADPARLIQVLTNLISNACKFSPANEVITLTLDASNNIAEIAVSDKGIGIPAEFQSHVFEKFAQADSSDTRGKGGTGLGLSICKSIIEQFGGTIHFVSTPGEGTTFCFRLPLAETKKTVIDPLKPVEKSRRLLLCEDDVDQSNYLKLLLEGVGFTIDIAPTISKAKELLALYQYKALLLDLIMPDQDGISFIRELFTNEKTHDLHIIVLSAIADTGQNMLHKEHVLVDDWLEKPVDFKQLLVSINRIKEEKSLNLPRILHIEDDPDIQDLVKTVLNNHAEVFASDNLHQAIEALKITQYDLIILDLLLPDGNGGEQLPFLATFSTPILVFSAFQVSKELNQYINQSLIKSVSSNDLLKSILTLLKTNRRKE